MRAPSAVRGGLQVAFLSWAMLTVSALTPPAAHATIAWRDAPNGSPSTTVHAMGDDGSGAHVVARRSRGFELSPDGASIAYEARGGVLVRSTAPGAGPGWMLRRGATIGATAWAPDGRTLALGVGRHVLIVTPSGRVRTAVGVGGTRGEIGGIGFAPDGRRLAVTVHDRAAASIRARLIVVSARGRRLRELRLAQRHAFRPGWSGADLYVDAGFYDLAEFADDTTELHWYRVPADLGARPVRLADDGAAPYERATAAAGAKAAALGADRPWEPEVRG